MLSVVTAQEERPHWRRTQGTEGTPPFWFCPFSPPQPGLRAACSLQSHTPEPSATQHLSAVPHSILIYLPGNCSQRPPSERSWGLPCWTPFFCHLCKKPTSTDWWSSSCCHHSDAGTLPFWGWGSCAARSEWGRDRALGTTHRCAHAYTHMCTCTHTCMHTHTPSLGQKEGQVGTGQ